LRIGGPLNPQPAIRNPQWVVLLGVVGCAAVQDPPGGPPDYTPPAILSTKPDSGAQVPGWRDAAVIQFDEVVDERSGGSLDKLITLSPVPEKLAVDWKRSAIAVRPKEGWRPNLVYQLTLLPGIQDLRNNKLAAGRTIVFSTGGEIPDTRITGTVLNWEEGRIAARALVEAILLPDSLRYLGVTDSVGDFRMGAVPVGRYLLQAGVDANNNRRLDLREPLDSVTLQLDSTLTRTFWAFKHDTLGPGLSRVTVADSLTLRLEFNQALPPEPPDSGAVTLLALPDSTPLPLAQVWRLAEYDSLTAAEHARQPARPDTARADSARADTTRADSAAASRGRPTATDTTARRTQAQDTSRAARLLRERPKLSNVLVARVPTALTPGGRYLVVTDLPNLNGARGTSRQMVVVPQRTKP
jgi:hypothetical protein